MGDPAPIKARARSAIRRASRQVTALARDIYAHPELAFAEVHAATCIAGTLAEHQFTVTVGVHDMPTAFIASIGDGPVHVAFCAEYDALPAGTDRDGATRPDVSHACGHHLIAGAAVAAAIGLRDSVDDLGLTVLVIGTPGEELLGLAETPAGRLGAGKSLLLDAGAFDNIHAALMAHPCPSPFGMFLPTKACLRIRARFTELSPTARLSGGLETTLRDALARLGQVPFLYCERTELEVDTLLVDLGWYAASTTDGGNAAVAVRACLEEAASSANASITLTEYVPYAEMRNDPRLAAAYRTNARTLTRARAGTPHVRDQIRLLRQLYPDTALTGDDLFLDEPPVDFPGGTDMGNLSHHLPAIHPFFGIGGLAFNHSVDFTLQANSDQAYAAMLTAGAALAWTAVDAATSLG